MERAEEEGELWRKGREGSGVTERRFDGGDRSVIDLTTDVVSCCLQKAFWLTLLCVAAQRGEAEIDPRTGTSDFGGSFVVPPR